jgi:hypothetical protein
MNKIWTLKKEIGFILTLCAFVYSVYAITNSCNKISQNGRYQSLGGQGILDTQTGKIFLQKITLSNGKKIDSLRQEIPDLPEGFHKIESSEQEKAVDEFGIPIK